MADNTTLPGTGDIIADKDIGGVKYQRVILVNPANGQDLAYITGNNGTGPGMVGLNDFPVVGIDADDAVMQSANYPVYMGGRVRLGTAILTQAADGDAGGLTITGDRRLVTAPIGCPEDQGDAAPVALTVSDTNTHALIGAQASSVKIALWGMELISYATTRTHLTWFSGATPIGAMGIPVGGDRTLRWAAPVKTAAATALSYQFSALPGGNVIVTPFWYKTRA